MDRLKQAAPRFYKNILMKNLCLLKMKINRKVIASLLAKNYKKNHHEFNIAEIVAFGNSFCKLHCAFTVVIASHICETVKILSVLGHPSKGIVK